jgi:phage terminase small subunit
MGLRGRKPKPTELRRLEGNREKRPLPTNEPQYAPGLPERPQRMSVGARRLWNELVDEMAGAAVLRRVDKQALWQLAEDEWLLKRSYEGIEEMLRQIEQKAKAEGKKLPGGAVLYFLSMQHGRLAMAAVRDLATRVIIQRREFGLTPSSRSRISTANEAGAVDSLELKLCG